MNKSIILLYLYCFIRLHDTSDENIPMPWMGVLIYKADNTSAEEVTNIVMIETQIALANAKDIAAVDPKLLKLNSKAMFYQGHSPWYVGLLGHKLHPEHSEGFVNTIAILYLDTGKTPHIWRPISLLPKNKKPSIWSEVYNIGYTDRDGVLKQEIVPMEYVSRTSCEDFYRQEEINFDSLWPPYALCYKAVNANETCVGNAGMALASHVSNNWILMGLSTYGPGCSLPARYTEIYPYTKWIRENTLVKRSTSRRATYVNAIKNLPWFKNDDDVFFWSLYDDRAWVLYPSFANITEDVTRCYGMNYLMYKEISRFKTLSPTGIGLYGVKIIDKNHDYVACIKVYVMCAARSYIAYGEANENLPSDDFLFGKIVPSRVRDFVNNDSYMVITEPRTTYGDTKSLRFRFSFKYNADVYVTIWGHLP